MKPLFCVYVLGLSLIFTQQYAEAGAKPIKGVAKKPAAQKRVPAEKRKFTVITKCQVHDEVKLVVDADKQSEDAFKKLNAADAQAKKLVASCQKVPEALQGVDTTLADFNSDAASLTAMNDEARIAANTARVTLGRASDLARGLVSDKQCYAQIKGTMTGLQSRVAALDAMGAKVQNCANSSGGSDISGGQEEQPAGDGGGGR